MANISRSAKSGNDWTENELIAYNISVKEQDMIDFFGVAQLPALDPIIVPFSETEQRRDAPDDETYKLLHYLDLAHNPKADQEAAVDTFVQRLLEKLGYATGHRIILTRQVLAFLICGENRSAQTDVCIIDENDIILLLVQEDKPIDNPDDPEPQLVAEAIAAFQRNNSVRARELFLPKLDEITFPGITFYGTSPTFYKITVTKALNNAVVTGTFPATQTIIYRHTPRLPRRNSEGMKPLDNRALLIRYFQAFKELI
ncbi:hypothetical protein C8J56DRAFT_815343 [Mycena floridula]|nr:hypothetical protein C8J56DRAFT_815343 [Mycena floridula]